MNAFFLRINRRRGFTMTELIVVIGVIAVLAGILLAAMGGVRKRALATTTQNTMSEFSKACEAFQLEHGRYPGAIPENVIADASLNGIPPISSTENALLDLMGGYRIKSAPTVTPDPQGWNTDYVCDPPQVICHMLNQWEIRVNINRFGEGPLLFGRPYSPYFTPSESQVGVVQGQVSSSAFQLPDLRDAWGQPIVFVRRARPSGPLVALDTNGNALGVQPQFYTQGMLPYTTSPKLGEFGRDQTNTAPSKGPLGSILNSAADPDATFAQILRHPSLGDIGSIPFAQAGTAQGAYILLSAGPDGIYFSAQDGPGTPADPIDNIVDGLVEHRNPAILKEYDDIRIFGGG